MFFSVPACTHNIRLYVSELGNVWIMLFHTSWIFTNSKSQSCVSILITKNILHQLNLLGKNVIDFLGNKNFVKDKNSSRPLNTSFGGVTIKMQHSLTALQWNTQQRCILKCSKTICDQTGIIEIVARRHVCIHLLNVLLQNSQNKCTSTNGYHQNADRTPLALYFLLPLCCPPSEEVDTCGLLRGGLRIPGPGCIFSINCNKKI